MGSWRNYGPKDPLEYLETKIMVGDGCWDWTDAPGADGYGRCVFAGRRWLAHRFVYEIFIGEIGEGLQLDHLCRNRRCVRPGHLEPVTPKENVHRSTVSERSGAYLRDRTHCKNGHPWDEANTLHTDIQRICRACHRGWSAARRARAKIGG